MKYTYIGSDNTATNGTALSTDANRDVFIYKIIFGLPADSVYAKIYDTTVPVTGATTNLVAFLSQPTAAAGKNYWGVVDFTSGRGGQDGLHLGQGGNVVTNASQVTVVWEYADQVVS